MDENKAKALSAALQQIEKQFGKGSIMKMGAAEIDEGIQVVSTGSLSLPDRYFDQSMVNSSGLTSTTSVVTTPSSSFWR